MADGHDAHRLLKRTSPMMSGDDVKNLQRRLKELGFSIASEDGVFGPELDQAVREFQEHAALAMDGVVGPGTYRAVHEAEVAAESVEPPTRRLLELTSPMTSGDDVKDLQHRLKELGFSITTEDGIFGSELDRAVREYQERAGLGVDGVVGSGTYDAIDKADAPTEQANASGSTTETGSGATTLEIPAEAPAGAMSALATQLFNAHTRKTFVRSSVQEIPLTTKIIDQVMPYFPDQCKCISGHLDSSDQFWKVNYHWDLLVFMMDKFLKSDDRTPELRGSAKAIREVLMSNPPKPQTGYRTDTEVGATKDSSSQEQILRRHADLKQSKHDFEEVLIRANVVDPKTRKTPPKDQKPWWLAVAPVAKPGISKHGSGYALDIEGDNAETTRICKALGASLVFNESSHVHVEFAEGVQLP